MGGSLKDGIATGFHYLVTTYLTKIRHPWLDWGEGCQLLSSYIGGLDRVAIFLQPFFAIAI